MVCFGFCGAECVGRGAFSLDKPTFTLVMADRWLSASNDGFKLKTMWLKWNQAPKQAALVVVISEDCSGLQF